MAQVPKQTIEVRAPESEPQAAPPFLGGMPDRLDLLWGLLSLRRTEEGNETIGVFWGLLDIRTRRSPQRATGGDPYQVALGKADQRLEALRAASIFGALGLGFAFLAWVSDKNFWTGVWTLCSVMLLALTAGQLATTWTERFRQRFVNEEMERTREQTETRRALAGQHARDIQQLTASIAHEIRNPITAAMSLVQQMGEDPGASDHVEYATVALEELERVERSVSHLLRYARDEDVSMVEMRMADVIESALTALESRAGEHGVRVSRELDSAGAMTGDPEKLRRVVLNVVGNAIEALAGAKSSDPSVDVQMGNNLAGTQVWLRVRDNGPGIAAEELARIFQPFHTSKEDGTGLGLAISKKVVEAHGGAIDVESVPGQGTTFLISLPSQGGAASV